MKNFPKDSTIVTSSVSDGRVRLVVKSPCRHYSFVEIEIDDGGKFNVCDLKSRCGLDEAIEML